LIFFFCPIFEINLPEVKEIQWIIIKNLKYVIQKGALELDEEEEKYFDELALALKLSQEEIMPPPRVSKWDDEQTEILLRQLVELEE
jgi:hypothetical protein